MAKHPNEWYLNGIIQRNDAVIGIIFQEYLPMVSSFIIANGGNQEDSKDIFMDAMEALFRQLQFKPLLLTCSFSTYLFEICKRLWLKKIRRKKFESKVTIDNPVVSNISDEVVPYLEQTEQYKLLREKFALLLADCQKVLTLSWQTDKSMEEIANEMGWTYAYVRKRKHQCKEILVASIKDDSRFAELKD